jgi:hypothetical protein
MMSSLVASCDVLKTTSHIDPGPLLRVGQGGDLPPALDRQAWDGGSVDRVGAGLAGIGPDHLDPGVVGQTGRRVADHAELDRAGVGGAAAEGQPHQVLCPLVLVGRGDQEPVSSTGPPSGSGGKPDPGGSCGAAEPAVLAE